MTLRSVSPLENRLPPYRRGEERDEAVEHIEKLVNRTGEDREALRQVAHAIFTYLRRLENLT